MGSATTRVVVGEFLKGEKNPKVIGVGEIVTEGMRHGYVTNINEAATSIKKAIEVAEKASSIKITHWANLFSKFIFNYSNFYEKRTNQYLRLV